MPKAYWIARVNVDDPDQYKVYMAASAPVFTKYKAKFIVRGGEFTELEGASKYRNIVLEFKDRATALECFNSPEYQAARALRLPVSDADIIMIEGYEGPQPGD
ncbi:DUF1330 domain-containing protein [Roseibium sp. RKSG952]|uniref:DUF1330 domain-containing protein n=1 Tax=Roseibium sp. RKSG952 TaxID=2529384 RepID=UPI0012BBA8E4|nr:DUF1330 domain-containing protein [Roseibium sp. RKSG952]MTI01150.1 DUF1330 domain-containing protein [Roseibium sp. RKSG952]